MSKRVTVTGEVGNFFGEVAKECIGQIFRKPKPKKEWLSQDEIRRIKKDFKRK